MTPTLILPYFRDAEVSRFKRILRLMRSFGAANHSFEIMLAASWQTKPDDTLLAMANEVAPSYHFHCPTRIRGYPDGANAMFWDCMHEMASRGGSGFSLWFESDMCPLKAEWMDRLIDQWQWAEAQEEDPLLCMGMLIPNEKIRVRRDRRWYMLNKHLRPTKMMPLTPHINGGACYSKDFVHRVGSYYRSEAFDVELGQHVIRQGNFAATTAFNFARIEQIDLEVAHPDRLVLHGFGQDKEAFIDAAIVACGGPAPLKVFSESRDSNTITRHQDLMIQLTDHVHDSIRRQDKVVRRFGPELSVRAETQVVEAPSFSLRRHAA